MPSGWGFAWYGRQRFLPLTKCSTTGTVGWRRTDKHRGIQKTEVRSQRGLRRGRRERGVTAIRAATARERSELAPAAGATGQQLVGCRLFVFAVLAADLVSAA